MKTSKVSEEKREKEGKRKMEKNPNLCSKISHKRSL
jgi:hypothetical protein